MKTVRGLLFRDISRNTGVYREFEVILENASASVRGANDNRQPAVSEEQPSALRYNHELKIGKILKIVIDFIERPQGPPLRQSSMVKPNFGISDLLLRS
ncbi:hypothetical protein J6590_086206 [Homalodisca vitripennis]|nr:hypothetical protein J6590_086206 [Homalodisca vitripennis]